MVKDISNGVIGNQFISKNMKKKLTLIKISVVLNFVNNKKVNKLYFFSLKK